jgi:alpha-1,2-mannosyltransferase
MTETLLYLSSIPLFFLAVLSFIRTRTGRKLGENGSRVAFFHPYASGRGGGERVLWAAINGLVQRSEIKQITVYSLETDRNELLESRKKTFNIACDDSKIVFRKLHFSFLLEPTTYPIATIFGQSLGSIIVFLSGLLSTPLSEWPDVVIDTTGCPFIIPVAKLVTGAKTHAYVHYPTMSNDMLRKVSERRPDFNNRSLFATNSLLYRLKLLYYRFFLLCYRICGKFADVAVANSNWTAMRLRQVWNRTDIPVLYPPAAIGDGRKKSVIEETDMSQRKLALVSLAQFRPEKNHELQIRVFSKILKTFPDCVFWIMGGCRNGEDEKLIQHLKKIACEELKIPESRIEFIVNAPREEVDRRLRLAKCAIHTMVDEHFGISLLEYLEAKVPIVCHRSGGPELDILLPDEKYGFLATSENEFVEKISAVLKNFNSQSVYQKRIDGYNSLARFYSDERFGTEFATLFLH